MPQINILNILQGDNQSTIVDKVNYNFDQILSAGGGPQGQQGLVGPTGPIGPQGAQGVQGIQGPSGTKWFVQDTSPASGGVTGSNPWTFPTIGDYWLDPDSSNQDIYVFSATGWIYTGFGLAAGDIFQNLAPINLVGSGTGSGIMIAGTSNNRTLILSDSSIADYTPGGVTADNINYENAKLKIATDGNRQNLISFGRSNYDSSSETGPFGNIKNPIIQWTSTTPSSTGDYNISFVNPGGSILISSPTPGASSGVNLYADGEVSAQSASDNIHLKTNSGGKGVFADVAGNGAGFFEVSNQSSPTPTNLPSPNFYVDSIGAGIGIGTGQFLSTGPEARKLSVAGNTSISTTGVDHTASLFIGNPASVNYAKGTLYVAGYIGAGNQSPIWGNGLNSTGTSEAVNVFPSLWATSQTYGNVLQVKNSPLSTYTSRTLLGDGVYDSTSYPVLNDRLSGTGPDLTQEMFLSPGYTFGSSIRPLFSYQQKISNATNTTGTAPVFAISTFSNGSSTYNHLTSFGLETRIQTRNTNNILSLLANSSTSPDRNIVRIGTSNNYEIAVFSGPAGANASYGNVTVGWNANNNPGITGPLGGPSANFSTFNVKGAASDSLNKDLHALTVSGIQTIGTSSPNTLIRKQQVEVYKLGTVPVYGTAGGPYSMLKVHRNLFTATDTNISKGAISATGDNVNGGAYPNGIEITSYIGGPNDPVSTSITSGNRRTSSAIIVGATRSIGTTSTPGPLYASPTGFFVSDTGTNVGIGTHWNYGSVLSLDTAGASWSGVTSKALNATGDVDIVGDLSVTGDVSIIKNLPIADFNVSNLSGTQYVSDFIGTLSTDPNTTLIYQSDIIIYSFLTNPYVSASANFFFKISIETSSGNFRDLCSMPLKTGIGSDPVSLQRPETFTSNSVIIPANTNFQMSIRGLSGMDVLIYKFGK